MQDTNIVPASTLSLEQRRSVLQGEIQRLLAQGPRRSTGHGRWRLMTQTDTSAQLVQPKTFSAPIAFLWFFFPPVLGVLFYVLYYAGKKDRHLYVTVDDKGQIQRNLT